MLRPALIWFIVLPSVSLAFVGCRGMDNIRRQLFPATKATGTESGVVMQESGAAVVLEYYQYLLSLSEEDLLQEFSDAQETISEHPQHADPIRLAILLSLPYAPFKDYARSLTLVTDAIHRWDGYSSEITNFLIFFSSLLHELKTQEEQYQALGLAVKKEKEQRKEETVQRKLLERKLEELAAIEKNLLE